MARTWKETGEKSIKAPHKASQSPTEAFWADLALDTDNERKTA